MRCQPCIETSTADTDKWRLFRGRRCPDISTVFLNIPSREVSLWLIAIW
jgi:hypothetical protein